MRVCKIASGFINPKTFQVKIAVLDSHSETMVKLGLQDGDKPNGWREMHYLPRGGAKCRVLPLDAHTAEECEEAVRAKWPSFIEFWNWAWENGASLEGNGLNLNGLTSAAGLKLPEGIEWVSLNGLTSAAGLKLPAGIRWVYLGGLAQAKKDVIRKEHPGACVC